MPAPCVSIAVEFIIFISSLPVVGCEDFFVKIIKYFWRDWKFLVFLQIESGLLT
jgi:hypothetical protein